MIMKLLQPTQAIQVPVCNNAKLPTIYTLELTGVCNNFCTGCANSELPTKKSLRKNYALHLRDWKYALDYLHRYKPEIIRISGGEPTLHPEFEHIIGYLDSLNLPHALFTTGRWTKLKTDRILNLYTACDNFAGMLISLHGATPSSHNAFVESASKAFVETLANIYQATQAELPVYLNTVLTTKSCKEIPQILDLAESLGVDHVIFNRFISQQHPLLPSPDELFNAIQEIEAQRKQGRKCRIGNSIPRCFSPLPSGHAKAGYELCHISPSGLVRPDSFSKQGFGNIFETGMEEIWSSEAALAFRSKVPNACKSCTVFNVCRGGVLLGAETQDALMQTPLSCPPPDEEDVLKNCLQYLALTSD